MTASCLFRLNVVSFCFLWLMLFVFGPAIGLTVGLALQAKSTYKTENMKLLPRFSMVFLFCCARCWLPLKKEHAFFLFVFNEGHSFKSFVDARRQ